MESERMEVESADEAVIKVAGVQREITIMHVTDSHLMEVDNREEDVIVRYAEAYQNEFPGSKTHFENVIRYCNDLDVDYTVFTGDLIDFPSRKNCEVMEEQFRLLHSPYLYTLGNHEWTIFNHERLIDYPHTDKTRHPYYPMFVRLANGDPACQVRDIAGLRLIAIDNSNYQISEVQLAFFRDQLAANLPTLLFFHIPVFLPTLAPKVEEVWIAPIMVAAKGWDPQKKIDWGVREDDESTKAFYELLMGKKSSNLAGIFCGHVHFPHKDHFGQGRYQYVTRPGGYEGGYRKIIIKPLKP